MLRTTNKSFKQIAQELNIAESSVKKINYGKMQFDPNLSYPIRKVNSFNQGVDKVIDLLQNTTLSFTEIGKIVNKSRTTISRINNGETHHNSNLSYPIRKETCND